MNIENVSRLRLMNKISLTMLLNNPKHQADL